MKNQTIWALLAAAHLSACSVVSPEVGTSRGTSASLPPVVELSTPARPPVDALVEERWGLRVLAVDRSPEQVVLHYRVLADDRAEPVVRGRQAPVIIPRSTGRPLSTHKPSAASSLSSESRTSQGGVSQATRTYRLVFADPDDRVRPGDAVDVVLGDLRLTDLVVR